MKDIEINDGCSTQFWSIKVFTEFAKQKIETVRIYLETSHGKSKSDGLGRVVKSYVSSAVSSSEAIIRDAKELFEYSCINLSKTDNQDSIMENRNFIYLGASELEEYRENMIAESYKSITGTLKLHQVATKNGDKNGLYKRFCMWLPKLFEWEV